MIAWHTVLTVDLEIAAWSPSASARVASTSRTDRPRTNEAITNDSKALVFVTCLPNSRDANAAVVPRSFGRSSVTGPAVVFTVTGRNPLRDPGRASGCRGRPLVAVPAQELAHLGLQGGLHQQLRAEPGHLLQDLRQRTVPGEQGIDPGVDPVGG